MDYIQANTGGKASPYVLTRAPVTWTSVSIAGKLPEAPAGTRRISVTVDGVSYSPLVATCPAASCTNGDSIASALGDAATKAYEDAVNRKAERQVNVATAIIGVGGAVVSAARAIGGVAEMGVVANATRMEVAFGGVANRTAAAERVLFENKFPLDVIGDPKIVPTQALKNMSGNMNYVVLEDRSLVVGKSPHTSLSNNTSVQAAGELQLYNGNLKWLDNASGHYQPTGPQIQGIAESAFENIGLNAAGKFQFKVWTPDPSLPRGGKWVKK